MLLLHTSRTSPVNRTEVNMSAYQDRMQTCDNSLGEIQGRGPALDVSVAPVVRGADQTPEDG